MELKCHVQNYHWGKKGSASAVSRLCQGITVSESTRYAELWMGTHPSGPSLLKQGGEILETYLQTHPEKLGASLLPGQLPFLFKVLSVDQALSVQAHPTKEHAEELHAKFPDIYKDPNHKPELAVALTDFSALCGFRPAPEIQMYLSSIPEFSHVISSEHIDSFNKQTPGAFKDCFTDLMSAAPEAVQLTLDAVLQRLARLTQAERGRYEADVVEHLATQFPGDVGVLCVYFLNVVRLTPGQALYLAPNEPHAYLSGDCVECMANSDNVVRAGLTPKFRDVETLSGMLTYIHHPIEDILFPSKEVDEHTLVWRPPMPDFAVSRSVVAAGEQYTLPLLRVASILLVVEGSGSLDEVPVSPGSILLIAASQVSIVKAEYSLVVFQAFCNL